MSDSEMIEYEINDDLIISSDENPIDLNLNSNNHENFIFKK